MGGPGEVFYPDHRGAQVEAGEVAVWDLVVPGGDASPGLELVDQALDATASGRVRGRPTGPQPATPSCTPTTTIAATPHSEASPRSAASTTLRVNTARTAPGPLAARTPVHAPSQSRQYAGPGDEKRPPLSLPGMGKEMGAVFIAATGGEMDAFGSTDRLAGYAGLAPAPRDSGRVSGNPRRPRRFHRGQLNAMYLSRAVEPEERSGLEGALPTQTRRGERPQAGVAGTRAPSRQRPVGRDPRRSALPSRTACHSRGLTSALGSLSRCGRGRVRALGGQNVGVPGVLAAQRR
jgi:hypothetical protein